MVAEISLTGLASNDVVPGEYFQIDFAQGQTSSGQNTYSCILLGSMLDGYGSATADTVIYGPDTQVQMASEQDAINLFGSGSELHRMVRRFYSVNKTTPLYAVAVSEAIDVSATGTITLTNNATGPGTLRVYISDEFVDTTISTGDSVTTIAVNCVNNINGKSWWAVSASNAQGVITITDKSKGPRGNWIRYSAQIKSASSIATTVSPTARTLMTGGATYDSNVNALATILPFRYYYIVSAAEDATQVGNLVSQVNSQANPIPGITQRCIFGSVDTLANVEAITLAQNTARAECVWQYSSDWVPAELAANQAAVVSLEEANAIPRLNFDFYGNDAVTSNNWKVKAPISGLAPTRSQLLSALNNGVTPIQSGVAGASYLVKRITTRCLNGNLSDYRIRDSHKVTICDRFADDLKSKFASQFRGRTIANDPIANSTAPLNAVTPSVIKGAVSRLVRDYNDNGLLQNAANIILAIIVQRSVVSPTRMTAMVPLQPIDVLDQIAVKIEQVA